MGLSSKTLEEIKAMWFQKEMERENQIATGIVWQRI